MINQAAIIAWKDNAPWVHAAMVEQDLIICKALVCIFGDEFLGKENFLFLGLRNFRIFALLKVYDDEPQDCYKGL